MLLAVHDDPYQDLPDTEDGGAALHVFGGLDLLATAVLVLDAQRRVLHANPAAENLFEMSRKQLLDRTPMDLFGEAPGLCAAMGKAVASGASYTEQELELAVA